MLKKQLVVFSFVFSSLFLHGAITLNEIFPDKGLSIGMEGKSWAASELVGDNKGSVFFDVVFSKVADQGVVQRVLMHLRTYGRLTLAWNAYRNETLQCELTDQSKTYRVTFKEHKIKLGHKYSLGVTWDGDVVRVYIDGVAVDSGVQPLPIKKEKVSKINLGPYRDKYRAPRRWADDIVIERLRVWDVALSPAEVAKDMGIEFEPLVKSNKAFLVVPQLPDGVAAPEIDGRLDEPMWNHAGSLVQLIHGNFIGKSGLLPPHTFRLAYDNEKLYLGFNTLFPGGFSCVSGIARTPENEPEAWGAEAWEFFFRMNGKLYRFAGNYAGGTLESCYPGGKKWNGQWKWAFSKTKNIDDSVLWQGETEIPWKTLDLDGPYSGESNFNFARSWTIPTCGTISSLNEAGRGYIPDKDCPTMTFKPVAGYHLRNRTNPAQGEYEEEYSLCGGAKGGKIVYEVSLAARDGSLGFKRIHLTEVVAKAGEVLSGAFKAFTAVPGYDAIVHVLTFNGKTVMRQSVPYDLDTRVFEVKPLYLKEKVRVHFRRPFEGTFEVIAPDGKCIRSQHSDGSDFEFPFPRGSASGEYSFSIKRKDGAPAGVVNSFYPGIGEWEKQDAHKDWVLPPYSPLKASLSGNALSAEVAMRKYEWNKSFLPSALISQGEEMLASPVELVVGGEVVPCSKLLLTTNSKVRVGFVASGSSSLAKVQNDAWLEYDGVQYNTFTVVPLKSGCDLKLRYRLKRGIDKYLHASAGGQWGSKRTLAIAGGASLLGAYPILWTGNEEKGLCFFYESRESWNANPEKTYAFEKTDDGLSVTVAIGKKLPVGKEIVFSVGFVASPARPLAPNYPYDTFSISTSANLNRPGRRPTLDVALMDCPIRRGDLGSYFADLDEIDYRTDLKRYRWVVEHHGKESGARLIPYTCARFLSSAYPEVRAYLPEWTFTPEFALDYSHTGKFLYECCPASSATDFFVWKFKTLMKLVPEIKGIYLDFGLVHECSNKEHGCFKSMAILGQREFYRRLAVAQIEAGITNPVIVIHNTDCVQLPAMTFVTHLLNGENIRQESSTMLHNKKDILDTLGIEHFASELSTLPWGISNSFYMPYDTLLKKNGGDEPTHLYSFRMGMASIGAGLVHNTMQAMHRNHVGLFDKVIRIFDAFGVGNKDTRFIGYWRAPATVVNGKGVYVSCHTDGKKILAVISHLAKEHSTQDVEITFDLKKLGIKGALNRARDMMPAEDPDYEYLFRRKKEKGKDIAKSPIGLGEFGTEVLGFDGKTLKVHLPYHRFALVQIEP